MNQAISPVFVLLKDCGEVRRYTSIQDMKNALESIDVENGEYDAWDSAAVPLKLSVREGRNWLCLERSGPPAPERVSNAIQHFAVSENVEVDLLALQARDFSDALERVTAAVRARQRTESWWKKLRRRF